MFQCLTGDSGPWMPLTKVSGSVWEVYQSIAMKGQLRANQTTAAEVPLGSDP